MPEPDQNISTDIGSHIATQTPAIEKSFFPRTIIDWNSSDAEIVEAPSVVTLKERLHPKRHGL